MTDAVTGQSPALSPEDHRDLVTAVAAAVVEQVEPDELAVFDETAEEYFEDPRAVLDPRRRDEAVGFGIDAALLTPVVLAVVTPVVDYLSGLVVEATGAGIRPNLVRMIRRLFRIRDDEPAAAAEPPALTAQQVEQVRSIAYARACDVGLEEPRARLLADAVAGGVRIGA
jgi:hypothetical protein